MKKLLSILVVVCLTLAGCAASTTEAQTNTTSTTPTAETISLEPERLVRAYQDGAWDGEFFSESGHCASIESGRLWVDCEEELAIPDLFIGADYYFYRIITSDDRGTWVLSRETCALELWLKGERKFSVELGDINPYYTELYALDKCIVTRYGRALQIYDLKGNLLKEMNDVIDVYHLNGKVGVTTFEHANLLIEEDGTILPQETSWVRIPRESAELTRAAEKSRLIEAGIEMSRQGHIDECLRVDGQHFVLVNTWGEIYVDNLLLGHVALGRGYLFRGKAANVYCSENIAWLTTEGLRVFRGGKSTLHPLPSGEEGEIVGFSDDGDVVLRMYSREGDGGAPLYIVRGDTVDTISSKASDAYEAYGTLYFLEGDTVYYVSPWAERSVGPQLFVEGAYAVSHHADESEGAIVPSEKANWDGYGYPNTYSPWGDPDRFPLD